MFGGVSTKPSQYGKIMQPESIERLAGYIYVDRALLLKLIDTGMDVNNVDKIRALLFLNTNPGFDISSPLDNYDAVVMAIATLLIEENMHLIEEEIRAAQASALGLELEEVEGIGGVPTAAEIEVPAEEEEIPERAEVRRTGTTPEEVYIPEKIRVVNKKTGAVTSRHKATSWRQKGQKTLSAQEQFVYARVNEPIGQVQRDYIQHFKIYRSRQSLIAKQKRLTQRATLSQPSKGAGPEKSSGEMAPR
jgi:hypothetical protein